MNGIIAIVFHIIIAGISVEQILIITEGNANHIHYIKGNAASERQVEPAVMEVIGIQISGIAPFVRSGLFAEAYAESGTQIGRYSKCFGNKIELVAEIYGYAHPAFFPLSISIVFIGIGCIREMQAGGDGNARTQCKNSIICSCIKSAKGIVCINSGAE